MPVQTCTDDPNWSAFGGGTYTCSWWAANDPGCTYYGTQYGQIENCPLTCGTCTISLEVTSQPAASLVAPAAAPAFPPPTPEAPCCLPEGSVRLDAQMVNATRRCVRAQPPADGGTCAANGPEAIMRLATIRAGRIDERQLEFVVVRGAREDLSCSDAYACMRTVDCHGACDTPGAIELRNVGLEAHAYLHRYVSRYDSLAERTVFMPRPRSSGPICPTPHDSENRTSVSDLAMGNATHTCGHDFFNAPYNSADAQQASYRRPR
jgi:hypothetical protein